MKIEPIANSVHGQSKLKNSAVDVAAASVKFGQSLAEADRAAAAMDAPRQGEDRSDAASHDAEQSVERDDIEAVDRSEASDGGEDAVRDEVERSEDTVEVADSKADNVEEKAEDKEADTEVAEVDNKTDDEEKNFDGEGDDQAGNEQLSGEEVAIVTDQVNGNTMAASMFEVQNVESEQTQTQVVTDQVVTAAMMGGESKQAGLQNQEPVQNVVQPTAAQVNTAGVEQVMTTGGDGAQAETDKGETAGQSTTEQNNGETLANQLTTNQATTAAAASQSNGATPIVETVSPVAVPAAGAATGGSEQVQQGGQGMAIQDVINSDLNMGRVIRGVQGVINQNGGSVTLRLHPPEMGVVKIEMSVENNVVRANFQAEHESVRNLLTHRIATLQKALENQGMNVERITVTTTQQSQNESLQDHSSQAFAEEGRSRGWFGQQSQGSEQGDQSGENDQPQEQTRFEQTLNTVA